MKQTLDYYLWLLDQAAGGDIAGSVVYVQLGLAVVAGALVLYAAIAWPRDERR